MKTKRLWVLTLAALMVCGSASAKGFRRGDARCKKCRQEQRFQCGKQCRGKEFVRFNDVRFKGPRFADPRCKGPQFRDPKFGDPRFQKGRPVKKHGPKHHRMW